jgi:protein MAK11
VERNREESLRYARCCCRHRRMALLFLGSVEHVYFFLPRTLTPLSGHSLMSSNQRPAKKTKLREPLHTKPVKPRVCFASVPDKIQTVPSKNLGREDADASVTSIKEQEQEQDSSSFKIIAGSYERLLYGLQGTVSSTSSASPELEWTLKPIFIFPAHVSCIKSVAASPQGGKWLATGSGDEIIKVWDLRRRKEIGGLMQHEGWPWNRLHFCHSDHLSGSITDLTFPSRSHLISASEDGTICLFRARDWAVLRSLKGHKGRVNSVSVHPSGKVALSVGKDRTLYMWDLMRGKRAASMKLGFGMSRILVRSRVMLRFLYLEGELVRWSTTGSILIVQHQKTINVYSTVRYYLFLPFIPFLRAPQELAILHTLEHSARIHDVKFAQKVDGSGEVVFIAAEDRTTTVYGVYPDSSTLLRPTARLVGHGNRYGLDLLG